MHEPADAFVVETPGGECGLMRELEDDGAPAAVEKRKVIG